MKSFLKRATGFDYAVYWPPLLIGGVRQVDGYGQMLQDDPIEIKCRWENVIVDFVDREGKVSVSTSKVYTLAELEFGGILWHGRMRDADPTYSNNVGALEIRQLTVTPDFRNTVKLTTVTL